MRRLASVALLALAGCGYHVSGAALTVPTTAHTISIKRFANRTREHGLEVALQRSVEEEFRRRGPLAVELGGDGDVVLSGSIRRFQTIPVLATGTSEAVQFQGVIQVSFRLTDRTTGQLLYENKLLQESLDFGASSGVIVSSSPSFQRGTIDARDLANMTNVQVGEARRRDALNGLLDLVATDVFVQSMEGF
jgi:membrane protein implicated in regulation of membrane protease activity